MKLTFSAPVVLLTDDSTPVHDPVRLAALDGVASEECFSDYLLDDPAVKQLPGRGVSGGYLRFRFRADPAEVWVETEYDLIEPLTEAETASLRGYTVGQWSDGIGENFSQEYSSQHGVFPAIQFDPSQVVTRPA